MDNTGTRSSLLVAQTVIQETNTTTMRDMHIQSIYQQALAFAARKHDATKETVKGTDLPYLVHVCNVAMEILVAAPQSADFNVALGVQAALLHDTVENTATTLFGN